MTEKQLAASHFRDALKVLLENAGVALSKDAVAAGLGRKTVNDKTIAKVHDQLNKLIAPVVKKCDNLLKVKEPKPPVVPPPPPDVPPVV